MNAKSQTTNHESRITNHEPRITDHAWFEVFIILALLAVAAFFRLYALDVAPPGLYYDEAYHGLDALDVLRTGQWPIFFPHNSGREPLFLWLITLAVAALGPTVLAIRLPAVLVGLATVPATYLMVRAMFAAEGRGRSIALATLTTAWLAVSHWHVHFSRMGFRAIMLPLIQAIAFGLLWWAMREKRAHEKGQGLCVHLCSHLHSAQAHVSVACFALAGATLGLCLYTYTAGRFTPLILVAFVSLWVLARLLPHSHTPTLLWRGFFLTALIALVVFAPLAAYFTQHPELLAGRSGDVAITAAPDPARALWDNVVATVGMFGVRGDMGWRHNVRLTLPGNLAGKPVFDPLTALLFYAGVLLALWRWRRPRYAFLLAWLFVMLLPGLLSQNAPHFLRTLGITPAIYIFPALAIVMIHDAGCRIHATRITYHALRITSIALAIIAPLITATLTFHDYFTTWARSEEAFYAFHGDAAEIAGRMNELTGPDVVFVLPVSYLWPPNYSHKTIDYLYRGDAHYHFPRVDETRTPADLTAMCRGHERVYVVTWTQGDHVDADPKRLVDFLLRKAGTRVGETPGHGYLIEEYRIPADARFELPELTPAEGNFALQLALRGAAYGPDPVPAGGKLWVVLEWETLSPPPVDYKVTVYLHDGAGRGAGQSDALLLDDEHRLTTAWPVGSRALSYGILHVPPDTPVLRTPAGEYILDVGIYNPATMQRLWVKDGDIAVTVGTVQVTASP